MHDVNLCSNSGAWFINICLFALECDSNSGVGKNLNQSKCLRHQNITSPEDGIDGSKAVDRRSLEVSPTIGEAKSKKELELFQRHMF